jgi:hypothetical protein
MSASGPGRGCDPLGELTIDAIARDDAGAVTRLAITFHQHCEGRTAEFRGNFRYLA